ncbi:MAG: SBBP repeat-containing protein [Blastocatellia bacterium]
MTRYSSLRLRGSILILALAIGALFAAGDPSVSRQRRPTEMAGLIGQPNSERVDRARISESFGKLPLSFEANHGQTRQTADFIARGIGCTILLNATEAVLAPKNDAGGKEKSNAGKPSARNQPQAMAAIRMKLLNAEAGPADATGLLEGKSNYFIGNDPKEWRTDIPNYSRVRYRGVYPGIDVVYYGNQRRIEYDFVVSPHSDPNQIRLALEGAEKMAIDEQGDLALDIGGEQLRMRAPVIYQETNGARRQIAGRYILLDNNSPFPTPHSPLPTPVVGFQIGDYDANETLVIDPVLEYSTFYGGGGIDIAYGIAIDRQGSVYITGQTFSLDFPAKNPFSTMLNGASDAFVAKLNPQGNAIVFSTYIGGRNPGDRGWAIAVDPAGNVYFTGETTSLNFPTHNAAQPNFRGGVDGFVTKLNIQGNELLYSTYLGGSLPDAAYSIALDRFDNAHITGRTESSNFPTKNPLQAGLRGQRDAFVTKLSANGEVLFSTYLGGEPSAPGGLDEEAGYGVALDVLQNVYVTGYTTSPNFPLAQPIQGAFGGGEDAFVAKLNSTGSTLIYSTYLGGARADNGRGIAVDGFGNAYVTGYTLSSDFPRVNALQPVYGGSGDGFVAKLNGAGTALIYSTFLGGSGDENSGLALEFTPSCAIAVDTLGQAYVTGKTASQDFPVARPIQPGLQGDTDAFVAKLDPAGSALIFSTYLGSTFTGVNGFDERGLGIAVNSAGGVFVTGQMLKNDLLTVGPVQNGYGGGLSDAFIAKVTTPDIVTIAPVSAASFNGAALAPELIVAAFGPGLASGTEITNGVPLPTTLLGASVKVKDKDGVERPAPLFFVSPNQINFLVPDGTPPGKTTITVINSQSAPLSATVWVDNVAPGLFSADASGQGLPAAVALRVRQDGSFSFEPVAALDFQGRMVAIPIDLGPDLGDASDQVYLILFGAGFRHYSKLENVSAQIGGINLPAIFAGAQGGFVGQDQVNVRLSRSLAGRGNVPVVLTVDGQLSNQLTVNIR